MLPSYGVHPWDAGNRSPAWQENLLAHLDAHPGARGDNQGFAVFGQVVSGMNVVRKILAQPTPGAAEEPAMKGQMLEPKIPIVSMKRMA